MDNKPREEILIRNRILAWFQSDPHRLLVECKGETQELRSRETGQHFAPVIEMNVGSEGQTQRGPPHGTP